MPAPKFGPGNDHVIRLPPGRALTVAAVVVRTLPSAAIGFGVKLIFDRPSPAPHTEPAGAPGAAKARPMYGSSAVETPLSLVWKKKLLPLLNSVALIGILMNGTQ